MRSLISLILFSLPLFGHAQTSLIIHGASYHFDGLSHNEFNLGAGIRQSVGAGFDVQAGLFNNSQSRLSVYALVDWSRPIHRLLSAGLFAGTANNYRLGNGRFLPVSGLLIRAPVKRVDFTLRYVPAFRQYNSAFLGLELGLPLNRKTSCQY